MPTDADTYREIRREIVCEKIFDECAICRRILSRGNPKEGNRPVRQLPDGPVPPLCVPHITISSVPAPMSTQPSADLGVTCSWSSSTASTSVMTTLSLSMGTTLLAGPSCKAL